MEKQPLLINGQSTINYEIVYLSLDNLERLLNDELEMDCCKVKLYNTYDASIPDDVDIYNTIYWYKCSNCEKYYGFRFKRD